MRNWTIDGSGGTPRTGAFFIKMIHEVNDKARAAGQEAVFGQPILRDEEHYYEIYPRCTIRFIKEQLEKRNDNDRFVEGITFFVEDADHELQQWLTEARTTVTEACNG